MSVRLDAWLVKQGMYSGRDTAKRHIEAGDVRVNGRVITKPAAPVSDGDEVVCDTVEKYVGRGGYKLEKAMEIAEIALQNSVALDVGASTGGFTDCMLQNGARKVYAVDVGCGQLHPRLRSDPRVVCLENTDIRSNGLAAQLTECPTFCSVDVSFISLKLVLPSVLTLLSPDATLVCLIKPQFEAGRTALNKNGVVRDAAAHKVVLEKLCGLFDSLACGLQTLTYSPIRGGEGNVEYLAVLRRGVDFQKIDIDALVREAFSKL